MIVGKIHPVLPEGLGRDEIDRIPISKYTKHYYIGSERVASALGTVKDLGMLCEQSGFPELALIIRMNDKVDKAGGVLAATYAAFGKYLVLQRPFYYDDSVLLGCEGTHYEALSGHYWCHPDHLGSSSYIASLQGEITQHMVPIAIGMPFGETLVEEHLNSNNSPYKFNAKEYDAETGNYYYGARYYDPKWSTFLTPDPALESYPGISPYAYTLNNPVRYVDPTGMYVEEALEDWVRKSKGDKWVWKESITSEKQAKAAGLQYGGKTRNEVINRWGENTTDGLEGLWNRFVRKGHGQEFDYGSKIGSKVNPKIPEGIQNQRSKFDEPFNDNLYFSNINIDVEDVPVGLTVGPVSNRVKFESSFSLGDQNIDYIGYYFTRNHDKRNFNRLNHFESLPKSYFDSSNFTNAILFTRGNNTPTLIIEIPDNKQFNFVRSQMTGYNY